MVTALSSSPPLREIFSFPEVSVTNAKVQKIAFAFFGCASFFIANIFLSCGGPIAGLSILFYLLTATFAIRFFEVKDYDNIKQLEAFRNEAKEQTFEEVLRAHGLVNILKYEIFPLETFSKRLGQYLDTIDPTSLAKLYLQLVNATEQLDLSMENFRPLFVESLNLDTRDRPSTMFEKEDMTTLLRSGLLGKSFSNSYQDYRNQKQTREENEKFAREQFSIDFLKAIDNFDIYLKNASAESEEGKQWIAALRKDIRYLRDNLYPSSATARLPIWEDPKAKGKGKTELSELIWAHRNFKQTYDQLTGVLKESENYERKTFEAGMTAIDRIFVQ